MKIWSDPKINTLYIEGVDSGPTTDFLVETTSTTFSLYRISQKIYDIKNLPLSSFTDAQGNSYLDQTSALNYLNSLCVFTPISAAKVIFPLAFDPVANVLSTAGNYSLTFSFLSPLSVWTINHNLGYIPVTLLFSTGGMEIEADVLNISNNQVQITFNQPQTGFARVF